MNSYDKGDLVTVSARFRRSNGSLLDPAAVFCQVKNPAGTITLYTFGTDAALVKDAVGKYHVDINANAVGVWAYRFYSTGNGQTAVEDKFTVKSSNF
jgi:hypothetical protein